MLFSRRVATIGLSVFTVASFGCGGDNSASSPVSPSPTSPLSNVAGSGGTFQTVTSGETFQTVIDEASLGLNEEQLLKASQPVPTSPMNQEVDSTESIVLTATNAIGEHLGEPLPAETQYRFALQSGAGVIIETGTVIQGSSSTSFQITTTLDTSATYKWRVRPFFDKAFGPWSATVSFTTAAPPPPLAIVGTPTGLNPINGTTVTNFLPRFTLQNGTNTGDVGEVIYQIEVTTGSARTHVQTIGTHARSRGQTDLDLISALEPSTQYFWRARGRNDGQGKTQSFVPGRSTIVVDPSPWTTWYDFLTPAAATAAYDCCPPPNRLTVVQQVANETGYPDSGMHVTDFTQRVAEKLHAEDQHWGRRINISGPLGKDTVAYKASDGRPYSIDIVMGATGDNPQLHWDQHGFVGGTWVAP